MLAFNISYHLPGRKYKCRFPAKYICNAHSGKEIYCILHIDITAHAFRNIKRNSSDKREVQIYACLIVKEAPPVFRDLNSSKINNFKLLRQGICKCISAQCI